MNKVFDKERFIKLRKELGLSQNEMSNVLGIKQGSVSDIERGKTKTLSNQNKKTLFDKYRVNIDYLYNNSDEMFLDEVIYGSGEEEFYAFVSNFILNKNNLKELNKSLSNQYDLEKSLIKKNLSILEQNKISSIINEITFDQSNSLEEPKSKYNKELLTQNVLISNDTEIDILQNKNGNTYYMYEDGSVEIEVLNLPFPAYASYIQAYFDETQMMEELTTVRFAVDKVGKGNYMSFDIKGDSMNGGMLDDTPDGAKVLARELGKHLWQSFRPEKYGYILMTKDNIYHKDIVDYNSDNGKLTLHSRNPKCEDFTINLNDVYRIFYIIKRTF